MSSTQQWRCVGGRASIALGSFTGHPSQERNLEKMTKLALIAAVGLAVAGLSACSQKAQDETSEADNTTAADMDATTSAAVNDVDSATDNALGAAANSMDAAGNSLDNAAADVGNGFDAAGNDIDAD